MKPIFITNYNFHRIVLKYDVVKGTYQEIFRTDIPPGELVLKTGFYINTDNTVVINTENNVVGYYPSPEGPIGFYNNQRFRFADVTFNVEPIIGTDRNEFSVSWNGEKQISVCYQPIPERYYDPSSVIDEDMDLFILIKNNSTNPKFYSYNTISLE